MKSDATSTHQYANAKKAYSPPKFQRLTPESAQLELNKRAESNDPQAKRMLSRLRELMGKGRKADAA